MAEEKSSVAIAEISHGPSKFDAFMEKNQKKLIILAILIVLAVIAAIIMSGLGSIKKQEAGSKLYNADGEAELTEAIKDAPENTKATGLFLLAKEQGTTDPAKGAETLTKLLADHSQATIVEQAKLQLALFQLEAKETEKAKKLFEEIAADSNAGSTKPFAQMALANIAQKDSKTDVAKELFAKAAKNAKFIQIIRDANTSSEFANVELPKVVPVPVKKIEPKDTEVDTEKDGNPEKEAPDTSGSKENESKKDTTSPETPKGKETSTEANAKKKDDVPTNNAAEKPLQP